MKNQNSNKLITSGCCQMAVSGEEKRFIMKNTVSKSQFIDQFRLIRPDNFSYEGLEALFDYLSNLEIDTGEEIEFDPIAFCCDFTEYESLQQFQAVYDNTFETMEDIENQTTVIPIENGGFIIQTF